MSQNALGRARVVSAGTLALANVGIMAVGVLRTKLTSVNLGVTTLGAFSQATLLQLLVCSLATAGLITASRVGMSDGHRSLDERVSFGARLLRRPVLVGLALLVPAFFFRGQLAELLMGSRAWTTLVLAALCGVIPMIVSQGSFAVVQVLGSTRELLMATVGYFFSGSIIVAALLLPGSTRLAELSFLVVPTTQALIMSLASPTLRRTLLHRSSRPAQSRDFIGLASLVAGIYATSGDMFARGHLASVHGLPEVALLQPGLLFATSGMGLLTSALTQTIMTEENRVSTRTGATFRKGPWGVALTTGSVMMALSVMIAIATPVLIALFFARSMQAAALPLAITLSAEPLKAVAWIGGSTLLPQRRVGHWFVMQLVATSVQLVTSLTLMGPLGAIGVAIGGVSGVICTLGLSLGYLRPRWTPAYTTRSLLIAVTAASVIYIGVDRSIIVIGLGVLCALGLSMHAWSTRARFLTTQQLVEVREP